MVQTTRHSFNFGLSSLLSKVEIESTSHGVGYELRREDGKTTLPGQPWVKMEAEALMKHFRTAFLTPELDTLTPWLWLIGTPSEINITPLHHQCARGREILVTEHPGLHGVWYHDKIFIKPIPPYLLCSAFWDYICEADEQVFRAATGFVRTYCHLIQYEVDFRMAITPNLYLVPSIDGITPTFEELVEFLSPFRSLPNSVVSARYSYGFLRLSRLNHLAPIFLGKLTYFHLHPQWKDYLGRFFAPIVTFFAVLATILNCMQVTLAAQSLDGTDMSPSWAIYTQICRWFPIVILVFVTMLLALLFVFFAVMVVTTRVRANAAAKRGASGELPKKAVSVTMHGNR